MKINKPPKKVQSKSMKREKTPNIFTSSVFTPVKLGIENNFYEDLN